MLNLIGGFEACAGVKNTKNYNGSYRVSYTKLAF